MKIGIKAAVSPHHGLSQAFGIFAFSLRPQATPQCVFSSSSKIWPVTLPCPRGHSRLMHHGGIGAQPRLWLPPWVRPRLGDGPVGPTLQRVATPAQREVTPRRYRPVTLVLQPPLAPSPLLNPPRQLEEDRALPLLPPHSRDPEGTSFSCQHPQGWLCRRGHWGIPAPWWGEQAGWGWDAAPPTRAHPKRWLHPWPDVLAGFGVGGMKNKPVGRRAGAGSCAQLHHKMLPLLGEA